jgi:hypothetical protein
MEQLPAVRSELSDQLRVRNTFLELPIEPEDCPPRRRSTSAPPLGRPTEVSAVAQPAADGLPSVGSALHAEGTCKPCAFVHTKGCENGTQCEFCHLCDPDEKRNRQKARWEEKRTVWRQWRKQERRRAAGSRREHDRC